MFKSRCGHQDPLCFKFLVCYIFKSNPAVVTVVHYFANSWCVLYSNPAVVHRQMFKANCYLQIYNLGCLKTHFFKQLHPFRLLVIQETYYSQIGIKGTPRIRNEIVQTIGMSALYDFAEILISNFKPSMTRFLPYKLRLVIIYRSSAF